MRKRGRTTPYTDIGIQRIRCIRPGCPNMAVHQWQICADDRVFRPLCIECDYTVNAIVMNFLQPPEWRSKLYSYMRKLEITETRLKGVLKAARAAISHLY
jgi:hypothetical protein